MISLNFYIIFIVFDFIYSVGTAVRYCKWRYTNSFCDGDCVLWSRGCGEQLTKTMLARECAECVKRQQDTTSALLNCFKHKFLGNFSLLSEKCTKDKLTVTDRAWSHLIIVVLMFKEFSWKFRTVS